MFPKCRLHVINNQVCGWQGAAVQTLHEHEADIPASTQRRNWAICFSGHAPSYGIEPSVSRCPLFVLGVILTTRYQRYIVESASSLLFTTILMIIVLPLVLYFTG